MKLQEKINKDIKLSLLNKDKERLSILRVVKGEINRISKDMPDKDIIKIIKKMTSNLKLTGNKKEIEILSEYLPTMLEEKQLTSIIDNIIIKNKYDSIKDMKKIMSELNQKYESIIDNKMSSNIIKNKLK